MGQSGSTQYHFKGGNIIENSVNGAATATQLFLRGFDESMPSNIEKEANVGIFLMFSST